MKYTRAGLGRIFILRLEHGDRIPDVIEEFAREHQIKSAAVTFLGAAEPGSNVVVGPKEGVARKPEPMVVQLPGVAEGEGFGTIFTNENGQPKLHLHSAFGREQGTITGCTREGVTIWQIGEVIIWELLGGTAGRKIDSQTGFELLDI